MSIDELVTRAKESLGAWAVYTQPYEKDGVTVIAAARVAGGTGGGKGHDKQGQEGEGGGFGLNARPAGAYVIKDGAVAWMPAVDVNRLLVTVGVIAVATLLAVTRMVKLRSQASVAE